MALYYEEYRMQEKHLNKHMASTWQHSQNMSLSHCFHSINSEILLEEDKLVHIVWIQARATCTDNVSCSGEDSLTWNGGSRDTEITFCNFCYMGELGLVALPPGKRVIINIDGVS